MTLFTPIASSVPVLAALDDFPRVQRQMGGARKTAAFAHPLVAKYTGSGSSDDAAGCSCSSGC